MNTAITNQSDTNIVQLFPVPEAKVCSNCNHELPAPENSRRTSFGLNLCDDCLYS